MKTILIANQSKDFSFYLSRHLQPYFDVHMCHSGIDALTLLEQVKPDVFVLQLNLPHIDGLSVLQRSSYIPPAIIALTNIVNPTIINSAAAAGIQSLLLIPCTAKYVVDRIDHLIKNIPSQS